jgi:hypothetical protein
MVPAEAGRKAHMKAWRWLGASLVLVALSLGVSAQGGDKGKDKDKGKDDKGKVEKGKEEKGKGKEEKGTGIKLVWNFGKAGDAFYQEMTTNTDQTLKVMSMEVKQKQSQTFYIKWTTDKVEKDSVVLKQEIIGVKMDIEIGGNKISYDSTQKEQQANPLTDFFKALVGAKFTLTISTKDMKVTDVKGQDAFIEGLAKANPQLKTLLETILSDKALKQMADPIFGVVPEGGKIPDSKTWTRESKLAMGPIGTYDTVYTYKYEGTKDKIANIGVTTKLTYSPPTAGKEDKGLPFKIVTANLKTDKAGTGEVKFNTEKGRVDSSSMELELSGTLTIEIAGMNTDVELKQKQVSSLKTMDKNPIPGK